MKTIILLIALILCILSFGCEILLNWKYIPCYTNIAEIIIKQDYWLKRFDYDKAEIENVKTNIEYNVKLAESRLNEAEVKYIESIKKYKTTLHNTNSKSFIKSLIKQKANADIVKQQAYSEMRIAEFEYEKARRECGRIYALAKGEPTYLPVGKSPREIFELIK